MGLSLTIAETIDAIQKDLVGKLPPLLGGEPDFDEYITGYPTNQDEKFCCVRLAAIHEKVSFEFIIHVSLPGVSETTAYNYIEAVRKYLDDECEVSAYGYDTGSWEMQIFEADFSHGDFQALFSVTMTRQVDDCS
jgi:hypothetical protein